MIRLRVALVVALAVPAAGGAQQVTCDVVPRPSTRQTAYQQPGGGYNVFYGGGSVTVQCPSRGITLVADSVEAYGQERVFLIGNVRYTEPRLRVTSDYITYFTADERVIASGSVVATLPSGSTLRGPQAEYRRASPRVRPTSELTAVGRPTVTIVQARAGARPAAREGDEPTTVTANQLFMRGDSLLYGSGQVVIARTDLGAAGDSLFMNTVTEFMQLMRRPAIEGRSSRPFRLTGELIDLHSRDRQLERVVSKGSARAVSDDMTLDADTVEFRIADELVQAAFAWGSVRRSTAVSSTQRLEADSIDVVMPGQRVQLLTALGGAYAEAEPDTTRFRTAEKDWLRGDTIIARFDTLAAAPDSGRSGPDASRAAPRDSAQAQIRELLALGGARSYQHLPPQDSTSRCPAINYVRGDSIRVTFDSGRVRTVRVISGQTAPGVFAEPDSTCVPGSGGPRRPAPADAGRGVPVPDQPSPAPPPNSTPAPARPDRPAAAGRVRPGPISP